MKKLNLFGLLLLSTGALAACGTGNSDATKESSKGGSAKVAETSKQEETEFTLYTSQPEEDVAKLIQGFNEEEPNITVNVFRSGTEEVVSKVLAEKEAGNIQADALLVSDSFTFETLQEEDVLTAYESEELANIPEEFVDEDNFYTGTKLIVTGLGINTDVVNKEDITSFNDLASEQGMMPSPLYSGAASLNLSIMVQEGNMGWEYFENLKEKGLFVGKGNGTVRDSLINGEKGVGMIVDYMANRAKEDGAPIDFVYPEEGGLYVSEPIGLLKDSENQDSAEKFVDFVLSEEGQKLTAEIGYTPIREGIEAPKGLKKVTEIDMMSFNPAKVLETRAADKEKFAEIFGSN